MMSWHKVSFTAEQVADNEHQKLQDDFELFFIAAKAPKGMALFAKGRSGKEEMLEYFFTPIASRYAKSLIEQYEVVQCDKPTLDSLALMVGHADAWDRLINDDIG
jgi:hypothetical protein